MAITASKWVACQKTRTEKTGSEKWECWRLSINQDKLKLKTSGSASVWISRWPRVISLLIYNLVWMQKLAGSHTLNKNSVMRQAQAALWRTSCNSCSPPPRPPPPSIATTQHFYYHHQGPGWCNRCLALLPAGTSRGRGRQSSPNSISHPKVVTSSSLSITTTPACLPLPPSPHSVMQRCNTTMESKLQMLQWLVLSVCSSGHVDLFFLICTNWVQIRFSAFHRATVQTWFS